MFRDTGGPERFPEVAESIQRPGLCLHLGSSLKQQDWRREAWAGTSDIWIEGDRLHSSMLEFGPSASSFTIFHPSWWEVRQTYTEFWIPTSLHTELKLTKHIYSIYIYITKYERCWHSVTTLLYLRSYIVLRTVTVYFVQLDCLAFALVLKSGLCKYFWLHCTHAHTHTHKPFLNHWHTERLQVCHRCVRNRSPKVKGLVSSWKKRHGTFMFVVLTRWIYGTK